MPLVCIEGLVAPITQRPLSRHVRLGASHGLAFINSARAILRRVDRARFSSASRGGVVARAAALAARAFAYSVCLQARSRSQFCAFQRLLSRAMENCLLILPQMTMLPKRTLVSSSAAASPSKPLAKRALQSAVARKRLAMIRRKNLSRLDTKTRSLDR